MQLTNHLTSTISHTNVNLPTMLVTVQKQLSFVLSMTFSQLLMPTKFLSWLSLICRLLLTPLTPPYCSVVFNNILVCLVWPSAGSSHTCQTGFFPQEAVAPSYPSLIIGCHRGQCLTQFCLCCTHKPLSQILFNHSCPHQFFADDTQLRRSCSLEHDDTRNTLQTCISDITDWMAENKLQLNADKTETDRFFNSSKLKLLPAPLSICQATISFSDTVRNLGFYLDKDLSMKEHINFICKNCFPGNPTY